MPFRLAAAALLFVSACHARHGPKPWLVSRLAVTEETLSDNPALAMTAAQLTDRVAAVLDASGRFAPQAGATAPDGTPKASRGGSYRCHAGVTFTRESDEAADGGPPMRRAEVGVSLELTTGGEDEEPVRAEAAADRLFDGAAPGQGVSASRTRAFRAALDSALGLAVAQLVRELDAAHESDPQLIADLSSPDGGVRDSAVRQLADRRNPAAVPALIKRLQDPDKQVVLRAMGALEALRDPRAVKPLIDLTEHQDPAFVSQVVYVIGAIGGSDAEAFLFTLQNGSPDAQVRAAAAEASAELRRRRARADAGLDQAARR